MRSAAKLMHEAGCNCRIGKIPFNAARPNARNGPDPLRANGKLDSGNMHPAKRVEHMAAPASTAKLMNKLAKGDPSTQVESGRSLGKEKHRSR
jgi:hypothetical protein